jgi:hypothetical protein
MPLPVIGVVYRQEVLRVVNNSCRGSSKIRVIVASFVLTEYTD